MTTPKKSKAKRAIRSKSVVKPAKKLRPDPPAIRTKAIPPKTVPKAPDVVRDDKGRYPPGVSGNLAGRTKRSPVTDAYRALLERVVPNDADGRTYAELIALAAIRKAIGGHIDALRELTDRVEGKATQAIHVSGRDGGPIDVANLTPEQRDAELKSLAAELGYFQQGEI